MKICSQLGTKHMKPPRVRSNEEDFELDIFCLLVAVSASVTGHTHHHWDFSITSGIVKAQTGLFYEIIEDFIVAQQVQVE